MGSGGIVTEQLEVELAAVPSELGGQSEELIEPWYCPLPSLGLRGSIHAHWS